MFAKLTFATEPATTIEIKMGLIPDNTVRVDVNIKDHIHVAADIDKFFKVNLLYKNRIIYN